MKCTVVSGGQAVEVPISGPFTIQVEVEPDGEILPDVTIDAKGGTLDVYRSKVHTSGNINVHVFGEKD